MDTKKTLSTITAGVLSIAMCGSFVSLDNFENSTVEAVTNMSAMDIVNDMGQGWNLGNTFDCCNVTWLTPSKPSDIETAWGNPETTKEIISTIHDYGFKTVRIPVTWYQMTDDNYNINEDYLARVKQVVDWCQEEQMYAIVNMHWDDSNNTNGGKNWLGNANNDFTNVEAQYKSMWSQIATYFADYDNTLVFEGNNEPSISEDNLMKLNQTFVDTVRSSGGNNDDRLLLISSPETNLEKACSDTFSLPNDPANMEAVSIHYYLPSNFCVYPDTDHWTWEYNGVTYEVEHKSTWGSDEDLEELKTNFKTMTTKYTDNGIPVILGEYGVVTGESAGKERASILKFLETVATTARDTNGMTSILWDSGNGGDMQFFDRKNLTFFDSEVGDIYLKVNNSGYVPPVIVEPTWEDATFSEDKDNTYILNKDDNDTFRVAISGRPNTTGNGAIGYYDNATQTWVQNGAVFSFTTDSDGNAYINQLDENDKVVNEGFIELPVDATEVKLQFYSAGYWDNDAQKWVDLDITSDDNKFAVENFQVEGETSITTTTTTTTSKPDDTTTTTSKPDDTQVTTTTITSGSNPVVTEEPDFKNLFGYVFPLFDNGVVSQWENDGTLAQPVAITGNGDYSITIKLPEEGAAESIQFLALSSTLNSFQENSDEEKIMDKLTFTINSISVDGKEIQYVPSKNALGMEDDGACYRMSIYDEWSSRNVQDIDPNVVNTDSVVINFSIDGIVGAEDVPQTTTTSNPDDTTTTTTTSTTPADTDTTTTSPTDSSTGTVEPSDTLLGDANCDGYVRSNDLLSIRRQLLHLENLSEQGKINADVNKDGQVKSNDIIEIKKYLLHLVDSLA